MQHNGPYGTCDCPWRAEPARTTFSPYEQRQHGEAEQRRRGLAEEMDNLWSVYRRKLVELFDSKASAERISAPSGSARPKAAGLSQKGTFMGTPRA